MQRHGVPNDVITNLNPFALLCFIPLNDFVIYPSKSKSICMSWFDRILANICYQLSASSVFALPLSRESLAVSTLVALP